MDLQQLQTFDQVVQLGSFSKAGRRLNVSQPTISLRILALEQEIGGALFVRGGNRLQLTELGRHFLPYAHQALHAMTIGVETAQQIVQGKRGRVIIGTLPSLATGFFASALARLRHTHPQLDIIVHTGHSQQILEMLHENFIQAGFVTGPFYQPGLKTLLRIHEPLIPIAHARHPLARKESVTLVELQEQSKPFFHIDWNLAVKHWHAQNQPATTPIIEVPPHTAHDLLVQGTGVALLTSTLIENDRKSGRLVTLHVPDLPTFYRECLFVQLAQGEPLPVSFQALLTILREEARGCRLSKVAEA